MMNLYIIGENRQNRNWKTNTRKTHTFRSSSSDADLCGVFGRVLYHLSVESCADDEAEHPQRVWKVLHLHAQAAQRVNAGSVCAFVWV